MIETVSEHTPIGEHELRSNRESIYDGRKIFDAQHIPHDGYEMTGEERVGLDLKPPLNREPDGTVQYPNGIEKPYYDIARLRLGDTDAYGDVVLATAVLPNADQMKDEGLPGMPLIVRRYPNGSETRLALGQLIRDEDGILGRETFYDLPDTVSSSHLRFSFDLSARRLISIENLNPTNFSILLPPEERKPQAVIETEGKELAARAIDLANYEWK